MVEKGIEKNDHLRQYCSKLGHEVTFKYCRTMNEYLPCQNIFTCFANLFQIKDYIDKHYSKEKIRYFSKPSKPKIEQIYDIITKVKKDN